MKIYHYHHETGEFLGCTDASLDPLESKVQGHDVFLIPAHAAEIAPPELQKGKARVFRNGEWLQIEDHRGIPIYSTVDAHVNSMVALGPVPDGYTLLVPCQFPKWDGGKWVLDEEKKKESDNASIKATLAAIDLQSIRSLREWVAKQSDAPQILKDHESAGQAARATIVK
jgi:hypothetical protein